jgi:hypothetical protein
MVNLGFLPTDRKIPSPELSFLRLFKDDSVGWQYRGQYAVWTGSSLAERRPYRLLERFGNRVAAIAYANGNVIMHRIAAGVPFLIEGDMRYWLTFDCDALWLDTPCAEGRYALLAVGGAAGRPGRAILDWACPRCGTAMHPSVLSIRPTAFAAFLDEASKAATAFDTDVQARTCDHCAAVHPALDALVRDAATPLPEGRN